MEATALTIDDQVDILLHKVAVSPNLTLSLHALYGLPVMDESMYNLDHYMIEKGLLNIAGNNRTITGKGLEIVNFGGWVAYRRQLQKEKPRTLYAFETSFRKHEVEIASLKREIQEYKAQLQKQSEKDSESTMMIANLIEQNKQSKIMTFVSGVAVGLLVASALSALLI